MNTMRELITIVESSDLAGSVASFVSTLQDEFPVKLSLTYSKLQNTLSLHKIIVDTQTRNSGVGTQIMTRICEFADSHGVTVVLTPSSDFGGSVSKLVSFYSRFGFVANKGKNKDFQISDTMYRLAK